MCNKCYEDNCNCQNISASCTPIDASCVIYNSDLTVSDLSCIADLPAGTDLKTILETYDNFFCDIANIPIIECIREKFNLPVDTTYLPTSDVIQKILAYLCNFQDVKVKATQADAVSGYLFDKIETGDCVEKTIVEENGSKKVKINLNFGCIGSKINACFTVEAPSCITVDAGSLPCLPQPTVPVIVRNGITLTGSNCNGNIQWYNSNNQLVGTGTIFTGQSNTNYYAKCVTVCGESTSSNVQPVPPITTYTKIRKAIFQRNNCGNNACSVPCIGGYEEFSKTYTSIISQENVNSIAENDSAFSIEGQNYVNTIGSCTCAPCNCTFPTYNATIINTPATCNNGVIVANGQITIAGIQNANKFGYSLGSGDYSGVSYANAFTLNNFNQGNVETTPTTIKLKSLSIETVVKIRLFNNADNCFKDITVTRTVPDCSQENISIEDITVSCEVISEECLRYTVVVGGSGGTMWYTDCSTNQYVSRELLPNESRQQCSKTPVIATGSIVTENGICI